MGALTMGVKGLQVLKGVAAYFRAVMGADAYQKYLEHHEASGHAAPPLDERQFWRERMDRQDTDPQGRCC